MGPAPAFLSLIQPLWEQTAATFQPLDGESDCTGSAPWSSHDGPVYGDVVWYEAGLSSLSQFLESTGCPEKEL